MVMGEKCDVVVVVVVVGDENNKHKAPLKNKYTCVYSK